MNAPESSAPHLAAASLTVRYGRRIALDDVSLSVAPGSVYALLGLNGAGKSSLVRCLLGLRRPEAGSATLFGRDVWRHRAEALQEVGVVPEEPDAAPSLPAREIARFAARIHPKFDRAGFDQRLRRFGVPADVPFGRLSKGQKGQVALALALAPTPRMLILDDPTLGLDAKARRSVFEELIGELAERGTTVFLTTHELAAVEGIADRVGILREGRLLIDEDLESLRARFRRLRFIRPNDGEATVDRALADLAPVAVERRAWGVEAIVSAFAEERWTQLTGRADLGSPEVETVRLEELFLALVEPVEATETARATVESRGAA
ncbi:MAG TPA: ABC transporter ATP-binding protein [Thermoanaerobaculia bacterium]|jgi:ABC-2 type transport system ATP-binding protein|nr:ABC transporter ATP-binding protein [Thermoanaerobaculia bacterium]